MKLLPCLTTRRSRRTFLIHYPTHPRTNFRPLRCGKSELSFLVNSGFGFGVALGVVHIQK